MSVQLWLCKESVSSDSCDDKTSEDSENESLVGSTRSTDSEDDPKKHGVPLLQTIFNDIKNIVGEVMFSLAHALSLGTGLVPGICLLFIVALLLGYNSSMLGRCANATPGERSFKGMSIWVKGPRFAKFVTAVVALKTTITGVAFAIIAKKSFTDIFIGLGATGLLTNDKVVLAMFASLVLLPLVLLRDLSFLAYFSLIGIGGELFALSFILLRYWDGSYQIGGYYYDLTAPENRPRFDGGIDVWGFSPQTVILAANLVLSFNGGIYNVPKYYNLLHEASVRRWNIVTAAAFSVVVLMYLFAMLGGYLTFGENVQGFLLENYADEDPLAICARLGVGSGVLLAFPLAFTACRDGYMQVLGLSKSHTVFYSLTLAMFLPIMGIAASFENIGAVNSIGGALFGSLITLVLPGAIAGFAGRRVAANRVEHAFQWVIVGIGLALMVFGTSKAVMKNLQRS
eukprot:TRINITY_DN78796_c0_g1_i1.p1 TRINITY_DN78796_c0_g1~~TRINITY_DN78796_c0_g1_i1.p1  ORF type:complete len:456 (+),score=72.69 TRINITY_DN78796_c0_g1_i1:56-1423(+)